MFLYLQFDEKYICLQLSVHLLMYGLNYYLMFVKSYRRLFNCLMS